MQSAPNTLFLRLEGPLQAWGDNSRFVMRRTMEAPTKSGVIGLICSAMGMSRQAASERLPELNKLTMGVRIDRPGQRWWDYHTVGAGYGLLTAEGKIKKTNSTKEIETLVSRREFLCDASFLVALQGEDELIKRLQDALKNPKWSLFLGRKCCPPTVPVGWEHHEAKLESDTNRFDSIESALMSQPWRPRCKNDMPRDENWKRLKTIKLDCLLEWRGSKEQPTVPADAEVWYDAPVSFDPPVHEPRFLVRKLFEVQVGAPLQHSIPPPHRPRADYNNKDYQKRRDERLLESDHGLCVFCKSPAKTVHHITYRRAGGNEAQDDLRSLCRLCHDAVTMIEYGVGMGMDRIDPCEPIWRERIIRQRDEILRWRSMEARRRSLRKSPAKIQSELLEEED